MDKTEKRKVVVLLILLLVLAGVLSRGAIKRSLLSSSDKTLCTTLGLADTGTAGDNQSASNVPWTRPNPVPQDMADPMVLNLPKTAKKSSAPHPIRIVTQRSGTRGAPVRLDDDTPVFYLKGIIFSEFNRSSIITSKGILHVNEEINGARVAKIERSTVTFSKNNKIYTVRVGKAPTNNTSSTDNPPGNLRTK